MAREWWRDIPQEALDILRSQGYEPSDIREFPSDRGDRLLFNEAGTGIVSISRDSLSETDRQTYGEYYSAVLDYINGNDPTGSGVSSFSGVRVGGRYLETDLNVIEQQANAGDPFFDDLYEE
ncbi:hypothetical protein [Streptomyces sp. NPDC051677]|uniref:hypothetical protein n=1 Tax=Streptomyces sp. NPDC051677 TaxID=3365669 RepID=UPI0037CFDD90